LSELLVGDNTKPVTTTYVLGPILGLLNGNWCSALPPCTCIQGTPWAQRYEFDLNISYAN